MWLILFIAVVGLLLIWLGERGERSNLVKLIPKKKREQLEEGLTYFEQPQTLDKALSSKLFYALALAVLGSYIALLAGIPFLLLPVLMASALLVLVPLQKIQGQTKVRQKTAHREIGRVMLSVSQMIVAGLSPYQAVLHAAERAPEWLGAETLISELRTGKPTGESFYRWAKQWDHKPGQRFAGLLKEMEEVDATTANSVLDQQNMVEEAHRIAMRQEIKGLPEQLKWPNLVLFANLMGMPIVIIGILFFQLFSTMMG